MNVPTVDNLISHGSRVAPLSIGLSRIVSRDVIFHNQPSDTELDSLQWGQQLNGPKNPEADLCVVTTPRQLENSLPNTPGLDTYTDALNTQSMSASHNKLRLLAAGTMFMLMGLNDGATGAIIPYLETFYHIGYAVVSLIFVTNALGFISAAPIVQLIDSKWGRSKAYMLSMSLMTTGYVILVSAPPYPVVVVSFFLLGLGMGIFLAMTNAWVVNLINGTVILGFMHGIYGLGGTISPLIATTIVSRGIRWSYFYVMTLAIAVASIGLMGWSFRHFEKDGMIQLLTALEQRTSRQAAAVEEPSKSQLLGQAFKEKTTILGAIFIFFYQGAEVAISGWIISYLIAYRNGDPSQVGNVTSGFWAGVTLGRFTLTHFAHKWGSKKAVIALTIGAAACQLLVWLVPNVVGSAVAVAIVGLLFGPIYPCATAVFSTLLPRNLQISSLSIITSMGSSGGAALPFITGTLAQRLGTIVLHPIVLIACAMMLLSWFLLPKTTKRTE